MQGLAGLTAADAARAIARGEVRAEELAAACLEVIKAKEAQVRAWAYIDPDYVLEQARQADRLRGEGRGGGPLHGVPVGVKDVIETQDMPTQDGTVLHA